MSEHTFERTDMTDGLDNLENLPIDPMIGVSAIAFNMALKYHDINTVQDGTLYQQYKLEGKNMEGLRFAHVVHTAIQIEQHLLKGPERIGKFIIAMLAAPDDEAEESAEQPEGDAAEDTSTPSQG